jgi:lipopolysaccharide biosynthesis glycosyltransferase
MYIEMAVKHHRVVVDQDITNVIFDATSLPSEFNVMPDTDVKIPSVQPEIIHYANMSKYRTSEYPPPKVRAKILQPQKGVP